MLLVCCWRVVSQEHYPELMKDVKIRVIELMDHVLSTYDRKISEYTAERFARAGGRGPGWGTRGWAALVGGCCMQPCTGLCCRHVNRGLQGRGRVPGLLTA